MDCTTKDHVHALFRCLGRLSAVAAMAIASVMTHAASAQAQEPCHFTSIDAGWPYCGLLTDGTVHCWDEMPSPYFNLTYEIPEGTFVAVSAGKFHGCGLRSDGTAECWGWACDEYWVHHEMYLVCWEFAGGNATPSGTFVEIAAGGSQVCGIRPDGSIECWGGEFAESVQPIPSGSFVEVQSGWRHACAIDTSGNIQCWGRDMYATVAPPPDVTPPLEPFTNLSTSEGRSCVLHGGAAECWGDEWRSVPDPPGTFTQLSTHWYESCGLRSDGSVDCWGSTPESGALTSHPGPFVAVAGNCGLRIDGTAECWGEEHEYDGLVECAVCGNGIVANREGCDDGNLIDNDGCDSNCEPPFCGNGILNPGEDCDDGDTVGGSYGCGGDCLWAAHRCGNGVKDPNEECDDGNEIVNDGCESGCVASPPFCGNGVETWDEECDDGNAVNDDGCDTDCVSSCPAEPGQGSCALEIASSLQIRDDIDDTRDAVVWKWKGGAPASPFLSYDGEYQVCLYPDGGALGGAIRLRSNRWGGRFPSADVRISTYSDRELELSSLRSVKLEVDSGAEPSSKLKLKAAGVDLPDGLLPASASFTIEFHDGVNCWSSTFSEGTLKEDSFKARFRIP